MDEFYLVANGSVSRFDGDLDDYGRWLQQNRRDGKPVKEDKPGDGLDAKAPVNRLPSNATSCAR